MTTYLSLNGGTDALQVSNGIAYNKVVMDVIIIQPSDSLLRYFIDSTTRTNGGYERYNGTSWSGNMSPTGLVIGTRTTFTGTISTAYTGTISFSKQIGGTSTSGVPANIYDIKLYNGATLVGHYDMSTGTVQDQSGNGNNATLTGGTWLDDGGGGTNTPITATSKSNSTQTAILLDSRRLSGTFKSNSSANAAVLLDRMAESTTVSSTSSQHDGMTVTRLMGSTVKGNSTSPAANLTVQSGIWVSVVSNGKSNSSSSLVSQVSRLMVSTVKTQSSVTGGLRQTANVQSIVISVTGTTNKVTITTPMTKLVSRSRSNSFTKVASTMTKTNPKVTTRSFTKATGYLLNLQVVSQLIETIKFKRGNKASLPTLNVGEPAFTLDTDEMFVGSSTGNVKILGMIVETSVANLPSPSVTNHWQICGVLGDGSTTADALYICKQLANGTYDWVQFA